MPNHILIAIALLIQPLQAPIPPAPRPLIAYPEPPPKAYPETIPQGANIRLREENIKYIEGKIPHVIAPLYILYDESRRSRMLKAELGRDWRSYDKSLKHLDHIRKNLLVREIIWVNYIDIKQLRDAKVKETPETLPAYRLSPVGEFTTFPSKCFVCDTWPLLSVNAIINKDSYLPALWLKKVEYLNKQIEYKTEAYSLYYIRMNNLDINKYTKKYCTRCDKYLSYCECEASSGFWNREMMYSLLEKLPSYVPPRVIYPSKPTTEMPWEIINGDTK